jgi:hypothetical protein
MSFRLFGMPHRKKRLVTRMHTARYPGANRRALRSEFVAAGGAALRYAIVVSVMSPRLRR